MRRKGTGKLHRLHVRAIHGAWACARARGLCGRGGAMDGLMDKNTDLRMAIVNAWLAGYRHGKTDAEREQRGLPGAASPRRSGGQRT